MHPQASVCAGCGAGDFPPRLRCHRCGGLQFRPRPITEAEVVAVTRVHRVPAGCPHDHLIELVAQGNLRLLAAASFAPSVGCSVGLLQADDGAILISRSNVPAAPSERNTHV